MLPNPKQAALSGAFLGFFIFRVIMVRFYLPIVLVLTGSGFCCAQEIRLLPPLEASFPSSVQAGPAGRHVGNEIDFYTNCHLSPHQDLLVGYSQLFAGEFIKKTGNSLSPELFYIQYSFKW